MSYPPKNIEQGALHRELGIPQKEKIGEKRLEAAKAEGERTHNAKEVERANFALNFNDHGHHGEVISVRAHHSKPDYMTVEVAHGKRKKEKPLKKGGIVDDYDYRPTSSLVLPKKQGMAYHVGQKVGVGMVPMSGEETDEMPGASDPDDQTAEYRSMQRRVMAPRAGKRG